MGYLVLFLFNNGETFPPSLLARMVISINFNIHYRDLVWFILWRYFSLPRLIFLTCYSRPVILVPVQFICGSPHYTGRKLLT